MNKSHLVTIFGFIRKEFAQVLRDPRMRLILFVIPMIQMAVFGVAISTEVKNIKLATLYSPDDTLLRLIEEKSLNSKWFIPTEYHGVPSHQLSDPTSLLESGEADVILIAPEGGLTTAFQRGEGKVQLLIDATNVIRAQSVERYMHSIINDVIQNELHQGTSMPINFDIRILYNSSLESAIFMIPGTMAMILCIVTILLTSMSIAKEKELGTFEMIISTPAKTWEILLGKTIPFIILGMINATSIVILALVVFNIPMRGSFLDLFLATLAFIITTVSIGTLISTFSKNQQQAMMGGFIFLFVANLLAGVMFPIENMPLLMKIVAYSNPLTYFVKLLRNIMLKGGAPEVVWGSIGILLLMSLATVSLSYRRFKHTLN